MTARPDSDRHSPVFARRAAAFCIHRPGQRYLESNLGDGGHTAALLALDPTARIYAFELDPTAEDRARQFLGPDLERQLTVFRTSFVHCEATLAPLGLMGKLAGVICDPGLSWRQATDPALGFSFRGEGPLQMTYGPDQHPTAAEYLQTVSVDDLTAEFVANDILPRDARKVAEAIVQRRRTAPLTTTAELREQIIATLGRAKEGKRHVATRYFQAIRTAVTQELIDLEAALPQFLRALEIGGVGVLLSYQGAEARLMRQFLNTYKRPRPDDLTGPQLELVTPRPEKPERAEIQRNPAARSALLRAFRRVM